jgi:hypothetical protein
MKTTAKTGAQLLAKGQLWQTSQCFILIAQLGKVLVHYKMMKQPGQRAVRTQLSGIADFQAYLKANKAQLVRSAPAGS